VPPYEGSGAGGKKGEKARETVGRKRTQFQKKINVHRLNLCSGERRLLHQHLCRSATNSSNVAPIDAM